MSIAVPVTDLAREHDPAVVHANGTARVQTLAPEHNPFLADVLGRFADADRGSGADQHLAQRQGQADLRHPADGHRLPGLQRPGRADARRRLVGEQVRIGYSFWGFLGPGITDTPDGGRSHRRTLIDGLIAAGHDIVFLQRNRDLDEAGHDLRHRYTWDDGLPDIDALFLEWRWPIPGRNTTGCGSPGHTCDLHRQDELVDPLHP